MSKPREELLNEQPIKESPQVLSRCSLIIKKPDLIGNSKWELILDKKIEAKISDAEFLSKIKNREIQFSSGDKLICELQILTSLDDEYNVLKSEYIVLKVYEIRDKEEQLSFDI